MTMDVFKFPKYKCNTYVEKIQNEAEKGEHDYIIRRKEREKYMESTVDRTTKED